MAEYLFIPKSGDVEDIFSVKAEKTSDALETVAELLSEDVILLCFVLKEGAWRYVLNVSFHEGKYEILSIKELAENG